MKNPKHQETVYCICETLGTHVKIDLSFGIVFMQMFHHTGNNYEYLESQITWTCESGSLTEELRRHLKVGLENLTLAFLSGPEAQWQAGRLAGASGDMLSLRR